MTSHITARTTRPVIAAVCSGAVVIAAVCFGAVAVPGLAAPAVTASLASPPSPGGTPWG
jgi:hypothetical protein